MCVCMDVCVYVCQFPLAAYYERVARARMVNFSHKIRPVQPFVVLKFRVCAINGVHVRGASLPHFGSGRRRRRVTRAELSFLAVKTERFIPDIYLRFFVVVNYKSITPNISITYTQTIQ